MTKRYFYGVEYPYGVNVVNNGNRPNIVRRFTTARSREYWLWESADRRQITVSHPYVRAWKQHPEWTQTHDEGWDYYAVTDDSRGPRLSLR